MALPFAAHHVCLNTSICCWLPLVLQLASLSITGPYSAPSSFPFPVVSLLVIWHSCVFSSIPLWSIDFMPRFLCLSVRFLSSVAVQLFLNFWPLLWSTVVSLVVCSFSLWFSTLVKDKGQPVLSQRCSSWAGNSLPEMDTIVDSIPYLQSCPGILLGKETLYSWGCAWWQTNGKAEI